VKNKLTAKQLLFCKEYLIDFNGTQAAIRAGYSKKCAQEIASQNLSKLIIQQQIQIELKKRNARIEKSGDDVVRILWKMAELDLADYITVAEGGEVQAIAFDRLPEGASKLISKIKERRTITESKDGERLFEENNLEYELPEKTKCLEMLGRHYGLFNDKLRLEEDYIQPVSVTIQVQSGKRSS
jgi:phage terminase small subunit